MEWLDQFLAETSEGESPTSFFLWSAIAAASAILRKNVYIPRRKIYKLYPNIYVLLVGPSGMRKGPPVSVAKRLISIVNVTRVIAGRNSIQAVINTLSKAYTKDRSVPLTDAHGILISAEFSNFIINDPSSLTILTELYNTHENEDRWENTLKHSGEEILKSPCLSMLGATNEEHFKDRILEKDVKGGFMARVLCPYETHIRHANALLDYDDHESDALEIDYEGLSHRLCEIAMLTGKMHLTKAAYDIFVEWYEPFTEEEHRWDKIGVTNRIHDNILKISMVLSCVRKNTLIIDDRDMRDAMELCLPLMQNVNHILRGRGKSEQSGLVAMFLDILVKEPSYEITRAKLLRRHYEDFNSDTLNKVVEQAVGGGWLDDKLEKGERIYRLKEVWAKKHLQILEEGEEDEG